MVNQFSSFFEKKSKTLSIKQPIEMTLKQVDFPLLIENMYFSKEFEPLDNIYEWIYIFKLHKTQTHKYQQILQAIFLDLEISKLMFNKTNPTFKKKGNCFVCGNSGHRAP